MKRNLLLILLCAFNFSLGFNVCAMSYLNKTRLIISETSGDATLNIINNSDKPVLIQNWIDSEDVRKKPEDIESPFLVLPSIFKLGEKKSYPIRVQLLNTQSTLKNDRENLYWLNVLEIPPKPPKGSGKTLQAALRTRIKLLYRPKAIEKYFSEDAIKEMSVTQIKCQQTMCLNLVNNSLFHITINKIITSTHKNVLNLPNEGIISPLSTLEIPWDADFGTPETIEWIDDYGTKNEHKLLRSSR